MPARARPGSLKSVAGNSIWGSYMRAREMPKFLVYYHLLPPEDALAGSLIRSRVMRFTSSPNGMQVSQAMT